MRLAESPRPYRRTPQTRVFPGHPRSRSRIHGPKLRLVRSPGFPPTPPRRLRPEKPIPLFAITQRDWKIRHERMVQVHGSVLRKQPRRGVRPGERTIIIVITFVVSSSSLLSPFAALTSTTGLSCGPAPFLPQCGGDWQPTGGSFGGSPAFEPALSLHNHERPTDFGWNADRLAASEIDEGPIRLGRGQQGAVAATDDPIAP